MITLTRLSGSAFVLNADLIERLDSTPDTVVTLVDGKKYVVAESLAEIAALVRSYRGEVIAISHLVAAEQPEHHARPAHLTPVPPHHDAEEVGD